MSSKVLAGPPSDCCIKLVRHEGTPTGKTIEIGGIPTYIAEPADLKDNKPSKVILFYSDIWGPVFQNNQLIQDYFAENGFLVLGIDYFWGDSVEYHLKEPNFDLLGWAAEKYPRAREVAPGWLKAVKEKYGTEAKYFSIGYCFGAPFVSELAATDEVAASGFAHPALLTEKHFEDIKKPFLLLLAEEDMTFSLEARRKAEDILVERKTPYHIRVFSQTTHGFASKADLSDPNSRWAKEQAAKSVVDWFDRFV